jgi:hypothetical protein
VDDDVVDVCVADSEEEVLGRFGRRAEVEAAIEGGRGIVSSVLRKRLISSPSPGLDEDVCEDDHVSSRHSTKASSCSPPATNSFPRTDSNYHHSSLSCSSA